MRPTKAGLLAQEIWRPLPAAVEKRWTDRFGRETKAALRCVLAAVVDQLDAALADCA